MHLMQPIKLVRLLKMKVILIMTLSTFDRDSRKFKRMSLGFKYGELKEFYKLLSDFKNHKPLSTEKCQSTLQ